MNYESDTECLTVGGRVSELRVRYRCLTVGGQVSELRARYQVSDCWRSD